MNRLSGSVVKVALLSAVVVAVNVGTTLADGRDDLYFQQGKQRYFNQPQNARSFGMAGSTMQTSSDSSNVVSNPAGLGFMQRGDASVTYSHDTISGNENATYDRVEQRENGGQVLLAGPLGPYANDLPEYGNFGIGWSGYDSNVHNDPYNASTDGYRLTLAYAKAISETTSIGYSLAYFNDEYTSNLYNYSMTNGFRNTIGIVNKASSDLTIGASAFWGFGKHDIDLISANGASSSAGNSDSDEFGLSLGAGYQAAEGTLVSTGLDYEYYDSKGDLKSGNNPAVVYGGDEKAHVLNARVGVEQTVTDTFKVRGGYMYGGNLSYDYKDRSELRNLDGNSAKYNGWSAGAGLSLPIGKEYYVEAVNVDYGVQFRPLGHDDWQHVVTVSAPFSPCD